jgi:hypothetical protein
MIVMGKIIDRLLKENPGKRLEFIAISELKDPEEIKEFYEEYRTWIQEYFPEEIAKGRSVDDLVSTNLGYVIGYLNLDARNLWYDGIGDLHPVFGRC